MRQALIIPLIKYLNVLYHFINNTMKVGELIEKLKDYPGYLDVYIDSSYTEFDVAKLYSVKQEYIIVHKSELEEEEEENVIVLSEL